MHEKQDAAQVEAVALPEEGAEAGQNEALDNSALPQEPLFVCQYCVFRAGRERFCLEVLNIEEVVEWPLVTPVPLSPKFLVGVFNLRGNIVPVIDIAFTEGRRADLLPKHVVVARLAASEQNAEVRIGIASDEVLGTYTSTEPLLVDEAPKDVPHCCGMLRYGQHLALALDLRRLVESFPVPMI
ncbi:MAG TPA: chemotaxis protein CheW [Terriglobales bacterium]|nr:chemotaxis protein CheW [Terriglobales bacterium]